MKLKINAITYQLPFLGEAVEVLNIVTPDWDIPKILDKIAVITRRIAVLAFFVVPTPGYCF